MSEVSRLLIVLLLLLTPGMALAQSDDGPDLDEPPVPAPAPDPTQANTCIASFTSSQRLRLRGQLLESKKQLLTCASPACPAALRGQCVTWLDEIDKEIPTLVITAFDVAGKPTKDVRVTIDDRVVTDELDGLPIAVDPGSHQVRFDLTGRPPIIRRVVALQGVQNQKVVADFTRLMPSGDDPEAIPEAEGPPAVAVVFLVVGGLGVLVGITTGIVALARAPTLEEDCETSAGCSQEEIDEATRVAHAATASFAVGAAGLIGGVIALLVAWPDAAPPETTTAYPWVSPDGAVGIGVRF